MTRNLSYLPRARPPRHNGWRIWSARFKPGTDQRARKLLKECQRLPRGRQLVKMKNLRRLASLVQRRTGLKWKPWQFRDQRAGLVAFLMAWFPTQEELLIAVELTSTTGTLPDGYVLTYSEFLQISELED